MHKVPLFPIRVPHDGVWLIMAKNGTLSCVFNESFAQALHNSGLCYNVCSVADRHNAGTRLHKHHVLAALKQVPLGRFTIAALRAAYNVKRI